MGRSRSEVPCAVWAMPSNRRKSKASFNPHSSITRKQHSLDLVEIDPITPLQQQDPFHCIIHKLHTPHWKNHLQQFSTKYPNTIIIDPPELVDRLHNRVSMLDAVTHLQISLENATVGVPKQVIVNEPKPFDFYKFQELGLRFPVIAKPLAADGGAGSHELRLVFDDEWLHTLSVPKVLQEYHQLDEWFRRPCLS